MPSAVEEFSKLVSDYSDDFLNLPLSSYVPQPLQTSQNSSTDPDQQKKKKTNKQTIKLKRNQKQLQQLQIHLAMHFLKDTEFC